MADWKKIINYHNQYVHKFDTAGNKLFNTMVSQAGKKQFPNKYVPQPRLRSNSPVNLSAERSLKDEKNILFAKLNLPGSIEVEKPKDK